MRNRGSGTGTGTLGLTLNGTAATTFASNNITYTGGTLIVSGSLQIGSGSNFGVLTGTVTVSSGANLTYFRSDSSTVSTTMAGAGTITFLGTGTSGQSDYVPTGIGAGFTGNIIVNKARLRADTSTSTFGGTTMISVLSGGALGLGFTSGPTISTPVTIAGTGWTEAAGLLGAIRLENGATLTGPITLAAPSTIETFSSGGTVSGNIDTTSNGYALTLNASGKSLLVSGNISAPVR